jgi:Spy/CpxP family protein refolding chaperone
MQTLAALMVSMMLLTTALFMRALTTTHQHPPAQPASVAGGTADDHGRQLAVIQDR